MVENNSETIKKKRGGWTGKGFQPGQSGNPGGRPKKDKEFAELCEKAIKDNKFLEQLIKTLKKNELEFKDWLSGLKFLVERAYGKPVEAVKHSGDDENTTPIKILVSKGLTELEFEQLLKTDE